MLMLSLFRFICVAYLKDLLVELLHLLNYYLNGCLQMMPLLWFDTSDDSNIQVVNWSTGTYFIFILLQSVRVCSVTVLVTFK